MSMHKKRRTRLAVYLATADTRPTTLTSGINLSAWGVWLAYRGVTAIVNPVIVGLSRLAPAWVWIGLAIAIGCLIVIAVTGRIGSYARYVYLSGGLLWLFFAFNALQEGGAAAPVYASQGLLLLWSCGRHYDLRGKTSD